jgi:hypothetical protein
VGVNTHKALARLAELCFGMDLGDFSQFLDGTATLAELKEAKRLRADDLALLAHASGDPW